MTRSPQHLHLFSSLIYKDKSALKNACAALEEAFGPIDLASLPSPFDHSSYYTPEMGPSLTRCFISFSTPWPANEFHKAKLISTAIEDRLRQNGNRTVNIDPGAITPYNLMLLTTKNFSHRIPLPESIFAEVTLIYQEKKWVSLPWTYPDYAQPSATAFFSLLRHK